MYYFDEEIKNLRDYYQKVSNNLSASYMPGFVEGGIIFTTQTVDNSDPKIVTYLSYLHQSIPVMFCMAWEKFIDGLDSVRYKTHFEIHSVGIPKNRYNMAIHEIFLIRNCIVHNKSCASRDYIRAFPGKYTLGQPLIEIDSPEIDRQLNIFLDAFNRIMFTGGDVAPL